MSGDSEAIVFTRLWLPRPLDPARLTQFLERLAADPHSPWLVLEARATAKGVVHLVGVHPPQVRWLHQTLRHLFPGIALGTTATVVERLACQHAASAQFRPDAVELDTHDPLRVTAAVLSALAVPLHAGETLAVQFLLGPRRSGSHVRPNAPDPHQSLWSALARGTRQPSTASRHQLEGRAHRHGFLTTILLGVTASTDAKGRHLLRDLAGAIGTSRSTGVRLVSTRCNPASDQRRSPSAALGAASGAPRADRPTGMADRRW